MANGDERFGVTSAGFVPKPLGVILEEAFERTRQVFGPDVDLRSSSPLRKILELCASESALEWMRMEDQYYAGFIPTAHGRQLDHLGVDLGLERRYLYAEGNVRFRLGGEPKDGCNYILPLGTLVQTVTGVQFRTLERLRLTKADPQGEVRVRAVRRGPAGNVQGGTITVLNAEYAQRFLFFPPPAGHVQIIVQNTAAFNGGDFPEDDLSFRRRLIDLPRTIWSAEAIRQAVLAVDGVRDALVWDPYGGLDRTPHPYGRFNFQQRRFTAERDLCSPYFFDVIIAPHPGVAWEASADLPGVRDEVAEALRDKRPISIFPNLLRACEVQVGLRARVTYRLGLDPAALRGELLQRVGAYLFRLELGDDVLSSELLCALLDTPGVLDVRDLRLLRCPPLYGQSIFCPDRTFGDAVIEAGCEENLELAGREIATFAPQSELVTLELLPR
jgi:uncharacterized phage protein gp47/JayE